MLQLFSDLKSTPTVCASGGWACTHACALTSLPNILESSSMLRCGRRRRQNNNSALAAHFFWPFFLSSLNDYDVKIPNFTFYGGRKQATTKFPLLFLNLDAVLTKLMRRRDVRLHLIKVNANWNEREFAF